MKQRSDVAPVWTQSIRSWEVGRDTKNPDLRLSSHLSSIWIPHHGFLRFSLIARDLMMRHAETTLGKITWASIIVFPFFISAIALSLLFFPFFIGRRIVLLPGLFSTPQLRTDVDALGSGSLQRAEQIVLLIEFLQNIKAFCAFLLLRVSDKAQTRVTQRRSGSLSR